MSRCLPVLCLAALLLGRGIALPTTVIPPTFDELVARAQAIFLGEVVHRRSDWYVDSQARSIVTIVTFKVERVLKGQVGPQTQLRFLGGSIGGLVMHVDGMPQFRVGDRDVLFVSATHNAVSPLVGFFHGRFPVVADRVGGTARVLTHDRRPLVSALSTVGRSLPFATRTASPLTYAEFEALVLQTIAQGTVGRR